MTFEEYQINSKRLYPDLGNNFIYPALGLSGEAGEFLKKLKLFAMTMVVTDVKAKGWVMFVVHSTTLY